MRTVIDAAKEIIHFFPNGPDLTPDQNRALASLKAAINNSEDFDLRLRELNDAIEQLQVWRGLIEEQSYGKQIEELRDEIEMLRNDLTG